MLCWSFWHFVRFFCRYFVFPWSSINELGVLGVNVQLNLKKCKTTKKGSNLKEPETALRQPPDYMHSLQIQMHQIDKVWK